MSFNAIIYTCILLLRDLYFIGITLWYGFKTAVKNNINEDLGLLYRVPSKTLYTMHNIYTNLNQNSSSAVSLHSERRNKKGGKMRTEEKNKQTQGCH